MDQAGERRILIAMSGQDMWREAISGAAAVLRARGVAEIMATDPTSLDRSIASGHYHGLLALGAHLRAASALIPAAMKAVVCSDDPADAPSLPRFWFDDDSVARLAIDHLRAAGVGEVLCWPGGDLDEMPIFSACSRRCLEGGLPCRLVRTPDALIDAIAVAGPRPVGIFCIDDNAADMAINRLARHRVPIPGRALVVGVGNDAGISERCRVPITSVELPARALGAAAAAALMDLLDGRPASPSTTTLLPAIGVVVRMSSALALPDDPLLGPVFARIISGAGRPLSVDEVIAGSPVSRRTLEQRCRAITGATLQTHIRSAHLRLAEKLLAETDLPLHDIATRSGLVSSSWLVRFFRHRHGCTPGEWRHRVRRG